MAHSSYRLGDHGTAVAEVRALLHRLDLLARPADTVDLRDGDLFDRDVDRAVRTFQQQRGVTVDGIVGPVRPGGGSRRRTGGSGTACCPTSPATCSPGTTSRPCSSGCSTWASTSAGSTACSARRPSGRSRSSSATSAARSTARAGPLTFRALERLSRTVVGGAPEALWEAERIRHRGRLRVVVIDPGHGGRDRGACAPERPEVDEARLAEDLAARVEGRLAASGVVVHLSRGRLRPR